MEYVPWINFPTIEETLEMIKKYELVEEYSRRFKQDYSNKDVLRE